MRTLSPYIEIQPRGKGGRTPALEAVIDGMGLKDLEGSALPGRKRVGQERNGGEEGELPTGIVKMR